MISQSRNVIDGFEHPRSGVGQNPYLAFLSSRNHDVFNPIGALVGNDVVDLFDSETQSKALHPRFDERVFTEKELSTIRESDCAHRARWAHWAAKESAYKVVKKLDSHAVFSPIQFKASLDPRGNGIVDYHGKQIHVVVNQSQRFVHAVAATPKATLPSDCFYGESHQGDDGQITFSTSSKARKVFVTYRARAVRGVDPCPGVLSRLTRRFAAEEVGSFLRLQPNDIDISSVRRVPRACYQGTDLPVDISLSHHGHYIAFAMSSYLMPISSTSKTNIPCGAPGRP
jgi:phosphopantetheinyl transferase (holo-ACP synthase)